MMDSREGDQQEKIALYASVAFHAADMLMRVLEAFAALQPREAYAVNVYNDICQYLNSVVRLQLGNIDSCIEKEQPLDYY